mmetsp:Transcript_38924/g.74565  ORF Transcript_38924/g.74565 Transcript_38924/m.74565 type:complete len:109 (-) Transcript_38924:307-633(-)
MIFTESNAYTHQTPSGSNRRVALRPSSTRTSLQESSMPASQQAGIAVIRAQQKAVQEAQKAIGNVYLIGANDAITSKYIPLAMATVGGALFLDGAYKMYLGRGKKEGF